MKSGMLKLANRVKCVANMPISQRNTNETWQNAVKHICQLIFT